MLGDALIPRGCLMKPLSKTQNNDFYFLLILNHADVAEVGVS